MIHVVPETTEECPHHRQRKHPRSLPGGGGPVSPPPSAPAAHPPVNDGLVLGEAEDSGPGVSFLRFWGNAAYLHKTKTHLVQSVHSLPVLVKSCGDAYRVSELMTQDSHFLGRGRQRQRYPRPDRGFSGCAWHAYIRFPWGAGTLLFGRLGPPPCELGDVDLGLHKVSQEDLPACRSLEM